MQVGRRAVLTALLMGVVVAATAAHAVVLKGRGELHAAGAGFARLEFRGVAAVRGVGFLVVDRNARVETEGRGTVTELEDGRILYEGFGRAVVASPGERTSLKLAGGKLRLHVRGAGVAVLIGRGVVHTDDLDEAWDGEREIEFDSELE